MPCWIIVRACDQCKRSESVVEALFCVGGSQVHHRIVLGMLLVVGQKVFPTLRNYLSSNGDNATALIPASTLRNGSSVT
jgi:hypothetical protein